MSLISSVLFAVSASLDAFIVGISYGIRNIHIPFLQNLLVSLITLIGTVLSVGFGGTLAPLLPARTAEFIGSALLILIGTFYLVKFILHLILKYLFPAAKTKKEQSRPPAALTNPHGLVGMGLALSANNVGIGISASIAGLPLFSSALLTFLFSVTLLFAGNRLGKSSLLQKAGCFAEPLTGLLLIGLGLL